MFLTDRLLGTRDLVCNCRRIRRDDDRDDRDRDDIRRRRRFICREVDEIGFDGVRNIRLICREIDIRGISGEDDLFFDNY